MPTIINTQSQSIRYLFNDAYLNNVLIYIPTYQRAYSWEKKHVEQLFNDLANYFSIGKIICLFLHVYLPPEATLLLRWRPCRPSGRTVLPGRSRWWSRLRTVRLPPSGPFRWRTGPCPQCRKGTG